MIAKLLKPVDPAKLFNEITRLTGKYGTVTNQIFLDEARDPSHPFHEHFQWDDTIAANEYRLDQVKLIFRSVPAQVRMREGTVRSVAFVEVPSAGGYRSVEVVSQSPDMAVEAVMEEFKKVETCIKNCLNVACAVRVGAEEVEDVLATWRRLMLRVGRRRAAAPPVTPESESPLTL